ncbi:hypothetical protein [Leifsonia aquatica]|uniref:hypothetical protein n=1 Tax=Leifsonia aquatica TaxID=144185 RepID=UPI0038037CD7
MQLDQIHTTQSATIVCFTRDRLKIPDPFAAIFRAHLQQLPNLNTAAHRDNTWLFPGNQPGQPIHQNTLMNLLRDAGIDLRGAKNASLSELVLQMPAAVVADSFNYSYKITEQHRATAGTQFIDYLAKRL